MGEMGRDSRTPYRKRRSIVRGRMGKAEIAWQCRIQVVERATEAKPSPLSTQKLSKEVI